MLTLEEVDVRHSLILYSLTIRNIKLNLQLIKYKVNI